MNFYKILFIAIICCLYIQCSFSQIYKPVVYDSYDNTDKYSYQFFLPAGYKQWRSEELHAFVDRYRYPDGSIILVTDKPGGFYSEMKTKKYGTGIYNSMIGREMTIDGQHENGLYWKERRFGRIYISYFSVKAEQKPKYDSILLNISVSKKPI